MAAFRVRSCLITSAVAQRCSGASFSGGRIRHGARVEQPSHRGGRIVINPFGVNRAGFRRLCQLPDASEGYGTATRRPGDSDLRAVLMYNQASNRHQYCGGYDVANDD